MARGLPSSRQSRVRRRRAPRRRLKERTARRCRPGHAGQAGQRAARHDERADDRIPSASPSTPSPTSTTVPDLVAQHGRRRKDDLALDHVQVVWQTPHAATRTDLTAAGTWDGDLLQRSGVPGLVSTAASIVPLIGGQHTPPCSSGAQWCCGMVEHYCPNARISALWNPQSKIPRPPEALRRLRRGHAPRRSLPPRGTILFLAVAVEPYAYTIYLGGAQRRGRGLGSAATSR